MDQVWDQAGLKGGMPRVLINSLPKAGTHLLGSILGTLGMRYQKPVLARNVHDHPVNRLWCFGGRSCLLGVGSPRPVKWGALRLLLKTLRRGRYMLGHIPYQENVSALLQSLGIKAFFVIRDPRDVVVSQVPYYLSLENHYLHRAFQRLETDEDRLLAAIRGVEGPDGRLTTYGIAKKLELVQGWLGDASVMTVRFEEMVGVRGGGSASAQLAAIAGICRHIGLEVSAEAARSIGEAAFGRGRTYRQGQTGAWREAFTSEAKDFFKEQAGQYLIDLGYEPDGGW